MNYKIIDKCRICCSEQLKPIITLPSTPIGDNFIENTESPEMDQGVYPLELVGCQKCGLVQINSVVDPELIYRNYLYKSNVSLGLDSHFQQYAKSLVQKLKLKKDSFVVEVGCNDGLLLSELKNLGMTVLGFEPATKIAAENNSRGVKTIPDFFSADQAHQIAHTSGKAELIIANNVMANIDDLRLIMDSMSDLLSETGSIIIESGYYIDTLAGAVIDNVYHEHYSYLGVKALDYLCKESDLILYDLEHVHTKGGSIRYFIGKEPALASSIVEEYIKNEDDKVSLGLYENMAGVVQQSVSSMKRMIDAAKDEGKKIAAYGASVGAITLQYLYDLKEDIECFYDDNSIKKGLYSPGAHVLVKGSEEIYKDKPDLIVVLCWRYADQVIGKHQKYLDEGGKFIVPLPSANALTKKEDAIVQ